MINSKIHFFSKISDMLRFSKLFLAPPIRLSCKFDAFVNVKAESCPVIVKAVDVIERENVNSDIAIIYGIQKTDAEYDPNFNGTAEVLIEGNDPIKFENCSKIIVESPIFTKSLRIHTCGLHETQISGLDAGKISMELGPKVVPGEVLPIVTPIKSVLKSLKASKGIKIVSEKYPLDLETKGSVTAKRLTLNLFHKDSDVVFNGQISVLDLDVIAGKVTGNKSVYTERGSVNSTRGDIEMELLQVKNTARLKFKKIEKSNRIEKCVAT